VGGEFHLLLSRFPRAVLPAEISIASVWVIPVPADIFRYNTGYAKPRPCIIVENKTIFGTGMNLLVLPDIHRNIRIERAALGKYL